MPGKAKQRLDKILDDAIVAVQAGDVGRARQLLARVLEKDPYSEEAWLWLSSVADTDEQRIRCFKNVLIINPNNITARRGLDELNAHPTKSVKPIMPQEWEEYYEDEEDEEWEEWEEGYEDWDEEGEEHGAGEGWTAEETVEEEGEWLDEGGEEYERYEGYEGDEAWADGGYEEYAEHVEYADEGYAEGEEYLEEEHARSGEEKGPRERRSLLLNSWVIAAIGVFSFCGMFALGFLTARAVLMLMF